MSASSISRSPASVESFESALGQCSATPIDTVTATGSPTPGNSNDSGRDGAAHALGEQATGFDAGARQQDHELFAAVARRHVAVADLGLDATRELSQQFVAGEVTVLVVDLLEVIDVDHEARERAVVALAAREFLVQACLQIAPVAPARERIRESAANEARPIDGVLEAEGGDDGEVVQEVGREMPAESVAFVAAEIEAADDALLARERKQRDALKTRVELETAARDRSA